jgi:hypothetical protein
MVARVEDKATLLAQRDTYRAELEAAEKVATEHAAAMADLQRELDAAHAAAHVQAAEIARMHVIATAAERRLADAARTLARAGATLRPLDAAELAAALEARVAAPVSAPGTSEASLKATLGRAVAALQDARGEISRMATLGNAGFSCAVMDDIDAVLTDEEGKAAGDAHDEIEALIDAVREHQRTGRSSALGAIDAALAKVDARRERVPCPKCGKPARPSTKVPGMVCDACGCVFRSVDARRGQVKP